MLLLCSYSPLFIFYHRTHHSGLEIPGYCFISPTLGFPEGRNGVLCCCLCSLHPCADIGMWQASSKYVLIEDE